MKTKHTPAPWNISQLHTLTAKPIPGKYTIKGRDWKVGIASVSKDFNATYPETRITAEEAEANAKLIAAAPELLTALRDIVGFLETYPPYFVDGRSMHTDLGLDNAVRAIKKATQ